MDIIRQETFHNNFIAKYAKMQEKLIIVKYKRSNINFPIKTDISE